MECPICRGFTCKTGMTYDHEGRKCKTKSIEEAWIVHIKRCLFLKGKRAETLRGQIYNQEPENR